MLTKEFRRRYDLGFFFIGMGVGISWIFDGHTRDAVILAAVNYWGMPWSAWRAHLDGAQIDGHECSGDQCCEAAAEAADAARNDGSQRATD